MSRFLPVRWRGAALLGLALVAGCVSTKAPERTAVMEELGIQTTARRVRIGAHGAATWNMSTVELSADEIAARSSDPEVRLNTIAWKANAIPALQRAMYHSDPLVSYVDGWTLMVQMRQYFETGLGKDQFGEHQHIAVDALRRREVEIDSLMTMNAPAVKDRLTAFVYDWAEANPLDNELFQRRSVSEAVVDLLSKQTGRGLSQLGSLAEMAEDAQQMALVLASYMPKEIRWQSELLVASVADSSRIVPMLDAIQNMGVVDATTEFMQQTPRLVAEERAAVFREIAEERTAVLLDLERQRLETLAQATQLIQTERDIMVREVARMIADERAAVLASVEALTAQAFEETRGVVDHLMLWILFLGAGLAAAVFMTVLLYRRRASS